MKKKFRFLFFILGSGCLFFMIRKAEVSVSDWNSLFSGNGLLVFSLELFVWAVIYAFHTLVHRCIISDVPGDMPECPGFMKMYRLTVSALALNSATPVGMFGGESYRMLELESLCGRKKAFSSVVIMTVFYIAGHFLLFLTGSLIYFLGGINAGASADFLMAFLGFFSAIIVFLFVKKHRRGMLFPIYSFLRKLPVLKSFPESETVRTFLYEADEGFLAVGRDRKRFFLLYLTEFAARLLQSFEYYLVFRFLGTSITFPGAVLVTVLSSLAANLLPVPMQVGTLEGGLLLALSWLRIPASEGIRADVMTRMTSLICMGAGMIFVLFGNKKKTA